MWQRLAHRSILFAIEGPAKPWWAAPAIYGLGCAMLGLAPRLIPVALCICGIAFIWMLVRAVQHAHYRHIARTATGATCPQCGYSMAELPGRTCPECGLNVPEFLARVRRETGESSVWNVQVLPSDSTPTSSAVSGPVFVVVFGAILGGVGISFITSIIRNLLLGYWW